jgi:hypothetical protein
LIRQGELYFESASTGGVGLPFGLSQNPEALVGVVLLVGNATLFVQMLVEFNETPAGRSSINSPSAAFEHKFARTASDVQM